MPRANGDYVKVYLYLLRLVLSGDTEFSMGQVAKQMNLIRSDVLRAVRYWSDNKLIEVTYGEDDEINSIGFLSLEKGLASLSEVKTTQTPPPTVPKQTSTKKAKIQDRPQYSMEEIVKYQEATEVKELLYIAQRYIGRPLSSTDTNAIIGFIEYYGLPVEVVEYLIEYCTSDDHRNLSYMEKVAMDWSERNIRTVDQARTHTEQYNKNYFRIFRALGLSGRTPTPKQITLMEKWISEYNFAIEVIELACEKTITAINKPELAYVDTILTRWHNKGVKSPEAIAELDRSFKQSQETRKKNAGPVKSKNRFINYEQHDYDYDDLEKKMKDLRKKKSNGA